QSKIDGDNGRYHLAVHIGEQRRAENAAGGPGDGDAPDDGPVDIAMPPVRCAGCRRRENFGDMHHGARLRRRSAEAQHDARGGHPECHAERAVGARQELTWTTQRQITLTSPFQNAITTLTLGFPPSSVSSCTVTRITTLGFFARAFVHSRSIISAFSTSVSR